MKTMEIEEIKNKIKEKERMRDLSAESFAEEEGLADSLAIKLGDKLKPTQLRKVFSEIKRIRKKVEKEDQESSFDRTQLTKLMPTLAYSVGRGDLLPIEFYEILKLCLGKERLQSNEDFIRVAEFIEAVLAYQKYRSKLKEVTHE